MKIGILTFHWTINYGGILQAYALQQTLKRFDADVEFINFENSDEILKSMSAQRKLMHYVWDFIARVVFGRKKREILTDSFKSKYLKISSSKCKNIEELSALPIYDAYIVGSDQVWNPDLTHNPEVYLLSFVNNSIKIAYAASFGKASIGKKLYSLYSDELKKFDKISVREEDALELLHNIDISNVTVVLDPVLLLSKDEWLEVANYSTADDAYILCYYMPTSDDTVTTSIKITAKKLKEKTGYKIINIGKKEFERLKIYEDNRFDVGPAEFVSLVSRAKYIVTNSFHGTAFALKMNIPFYVPVNYSINKEKRLANRIECLLEKFQCTERIIDSNMIPDVEIDSYDFSNINKIMEEQTSRSIQFLKDGLNGSKSFGE